MFVPALMSCYASRVANSGLPRFHLTPEDERRLKEMEDERKLKERSELHRGLFIVYGVLFVLIFVYLTGARDVTGQHDWGRFLWDTGASFVTPLFVIAFGWFVLLGWWQLLERLGYWRDDKKPPKLL